MNRFAITTLAVALVGSGLVALRLDGRSRAKARPTLGNVATLQAAYDTWRAQQLEYGSDRVLPVGLHWSKALSKEFTEASGRALFDLEDGRIEVEVLGFEEGAELEAWLVAYRPGTDNSVSIDERDRVVALGRMTSGTDGARLESDLDELDLGSFELDQVVVARAGAGAREGALLAGSPTLFQRLLSAEFRSAREGGGYSLGGVALALLPAPLAPAQIVQPPLGTLVEEGETLFFEETFDGNGRTCGTCHPAQNNLTLDPEFIATLPETDALFVAEFVPALDHKQNGGLRFENPVLMREFGLILENLDGFGDLANRFTMRGIPHVFAQNVSITTPPGGITPPNDRTGWSGDGAPNDGTLRDFATGAVTQHFPKTLARSEPSDFRLPTADELNAMEAFQRSLGRQEDPVLSTIGFKDVGAEEGKEIFLDAAAGKCNNCHFNAGANVAFIPPAGTFNQNFNTGVEAFLVAHPDGTGEPRPVDGGFGHAPDGTFGVLIANSDGSFGNQTFNTASVVEAADTLPAFHNNITLLSPSLVSVKATGPLANTIEGAIAFYNSDEFNASPSGQAIGGIALDPGQVENVGRFLRVLNALDNEEQIRSRAQKARDALASGSFDNEAVNRLLRIAIADASDAFDVLDEVGLHPNAKARFHQARQKLEGAMAGPTHVRISKIDDALNRLLLAHDDMVSP
jgi:hypothetical protein